MPKDDVIDLWDMSLQFMYGQEYVDGLVWFLKKNNVQSILDCGRGVGFPAIQLSQKGFDVVCVDESRAAIERLELNLAKQHTVLQFYQKDWRAIHTLNRKFDAVLCHGNSLVYVGTWDKRKTLENTLNKIIAMLQNMYEVLNDGGMLYVDITPQTEYNDGTRITRLGPRMVDGKEVEICWETKHDWDNRTRVVRSRRSINSEVFTYDYHSFMLEHDELKVLLRGVGFSKVEAVTIPGEERYDVYVAHK